MLEVCHTSGLIKMNRESKHREKKLYKSCISQQTAFNFLTLSEDIYELRAMLKEILHSLKEKRNY